MDPFGIIVIVVVAVIIIIIIIIAVVVGVNSTNNSTTVTNQCSSQNDCALGFVCAHDATTNTNSCKASHGGPCQADSDCDANLVCRNNICNKPLPPIPARPPIQPNNINATVPRRRIGTVGLNPPENISSTTANPAPNPIPTFNTIADPSTVGGLLGRMQNPDSITPITPTSAEGELNQDFTFTRPQTQATPAQTPRPQTPAPLSPRGGILRTQTPAPLSPRGGTDLMQTPNGRVHGGEQTPGGGVARQGGTPLEEVYSGGMQEGMQDEMECNSGELGSIRSRHETKDRIITPRFQEGGFNQGVGMGAAGMGAADMGAGAAIGGGRRPSQGVRDVGASVGIGAGVRVGRRNNGEATTPIEMDSAESTIRVPTVRASTMQPPTFQISNRKPKSGSYTPIDFNNSDDILHPHDGYDVQDFRAEPAQQHATQLPHPAHTVHWNNQEDGQKQRAEAGGQRNNQGWEGGQRAVRGEAGGQRNNQGWGGGQRVVRGGGHGAIVQGGRNARRGRRVMLELSSSDDQSNTDGRRMDAPFEVQSRDTTDNERGGWEERDRDRGGRGNWGGDGGREYEMEDGVASVSTPCEEREGVYYCRNGGIDGGIEGGVGGINVEGINAGGVGGSPVVDVCSYSTAVVFLLEDSHIICEQGTKRYRTNNNVKLYRIAAFNGYLYGISLDHRLYTLPNNCFPTPNWSWLPVDWAPLSIQHICSTHDGSHLWLQTETTGYLYATAGQIKLKESCPGIKRVYGRDCDHYLNIHNSTHTATVYPEGKVVHNVYDGTLSFYDEVIAIHPSDAHEYRGITIVNWQAYYIR